MSHDPVQAWASVEAWLGAHAPRSAGVLSPPADPASIAHAEGVTGVPWPDALKTLLLAHDGVDDPYDDASGIFFGAPLLSVQGILIALEQLVVVAGVMDDFGIPAAMDPAAGGPVGHYVPWLLPFAGLEGSFWVLDLRPGEQSGCVCYYSPVEQLVAPAAAASRVEFTAQLALCLSTSAPWNGVLRPFVTDGALDWAELDAAEVVDLR
ncbi:cell wall assembly regulator SMI1 [Motilibacter peucedani]|uniref:Cell wall assembly regulator SMI1 n=1 Tax=Motilibacter peucedani TaxID=598650 RepID=A0A420XP13_9ACTN|nr:SMI1/KNR4 family protein [Motilibacter peucedani]RKS73927.1 cell wall assembly regulator SMI1 [Motilibacter peucedani]